MFGLFHLPDFSPHIVLAYPIEVKQAAAFA
jgi:hypothetical protein